MPKIPGVNHLNAVRAFKKAGFRIVRQGKHIVMTDGVRILTIPRHNPVNSYTMGGLVQDSGISVDEFRKLLQDHNLVTTTVELAPMQKLLNNGNRHSYS